MSQRPAVHLAIPVDDLPAARLFYGQVLGLPEGRSTDHWVDWDFEGHQLVTHLVPSAPQPVGNSQVERHSVPIPHFGLLLTEERFHAYAQRLRSAGVRFDIEPYLRFAGEPAEQWTMFFRDPAGNALEFKSFRDESMVFAR
ncbi:VOC family protein [Streptacidiphilus neutrinimicus]|uniref:VOC family protein n=1 Tax=Streptacidiphilus neutrinimicus TaxID=105420 RepID=UPI0005AAA854|nr:VOC family protein [Streptacidiphilus neutrinimicus]